MHDDGYFDESVAATYDDDVAPFAPSAVDEVVDFLAELAGDGAALEFAVGDSPGKSSRDVGIVDRTVRLRPEVFYLKPFVSDVAQELFLEVVSCMFTGNGDSHCRSLRAAFRSRVLGAL